MVYTYLYTRFGIGWFAHVLMHQHFEPQRRTSIRPHCLSTTCPVSVSEPTTSTTGASSGSKSVQSLLKCHFRQGGNKWKLPRVATALGHPAVQSPSGPRASRLLSFVDVVEVLEGSAQRKHLVIRAMQPQDTGGHGRTGKDETGGLPEVGIPRNSFIGVIGASVVFQRSISGSLTMACNH